MFKSLLIANRGEIAVRVARTARRMGLRTVAVYSDADRDSPHVRVADTAVHIGSASPRESCLSIAALLKAQADAVHPGYGFHSPSGRLQAALAAASMNHCDEKHRSTTPKHAATAGISRHGREGISYPLRDEADFQ